MIDRNRMSESINVSTLKLEFKRSVGPLVSLLIGLIVAIACGDYILTNIDGGIGSTHQLQFVVSDATGVVPGRAESRFYGINAGQITNAVVEHGHAVLTVTIADKFGPIYKNAQAELRPNTPLNDMYLDVVNRGTPSAGVAGPNYVIPLDQTQSPTNLADVLDLFQPDVSAQLNTALDQLGNGLQDRGAALRQGFIELAPLLAVAGNISQQLASRATLTKALVHNASTLSGVLASRSTQLHQLVTSGTSTLDALSTEGGTPLRQTISEAPFTFFDVARVFDAWNADTQGLEQTVQAVTPVADELPSGLTNLMSLARSAEPAVTKLQKPVRDLVPLATALDPLAADLSGSLHRIRPQVSDVNIVTQALSTCGNRLNEFFNWDDSMAKFVDSQGPMVRGNVHVGFYSLTSVPDPNFTSLAPQCAGGTPISAVPTPKLNGPAPAP